MRKRSYRVEVYFTKDELGVLNQKVNKSSIPREVFIRNLLNDCIIKEAPPAEYYDLIREVRRVGSNLNQILKLANAKGLLDVPQLRKDLEQIRATEKILWAAFDSGDE
ncbi:MAG: plasmid mobilization relaxosome protein MobC [Selenomonadaceae bacterium]